MPQTADALDAFLGRLSQYILNPLIGLLFAVALAYFVWGIVQFIRNSDSDTSRAEGQQHMIWGIIGMFIMIAVFGIIQLIMGTFGITNVPLPRQ
ncbi:hypothetical protein KW797_00930 [Candidatus Parcubacteria bacterium]|nr:hypothetical protein [Candidatus Parcubacteria bacterium]